jgi:hypothetical protein
MLAKHPLVLFYVPAEAESSRAGAGAYGLTAIALGALGYLYIRWKVNIYSPVNSV